jgi:hypothetical protein
MRLSNTSRHQDDILTRAEETFGDTITEVLNIVEDLDLQITKLLEDAGNLHQDINDLEIQLSAANDRISELESK